MHRVGRGRAVATAGALLAVLTVPASATTLEDPSAALARTQDELAAATAELAQLETRVDGAAAEVTAADQLLATLSGELVAVEEALAAAVRAAADAERDLGDARGRLTDADARLADADSRSRATRGGLDQRAAQLWMRGPASGATAVLSSLGNARDLHDVAVVAQATRRQLDEDRQLVEDARGAAATAAAARADVEDERAAVTRVTAAAYVARDEAAALVVRQTRLVDEASRQREVRQRALASIEQDAAARALLVTRLTTRAEELRTELLDDWLRASQELPSDGPAPAWAAQLPPSGRAFAPAIEAAAAAAGIDGRLFASLVWTESAFRPTAVSPAGAIGLAQLMPGTAAGLGVDPWDPMDNLHGGARYLRAQLDTFGRVDLALAAYNAGPGRVRRAGNAIPDIVETQLYVLRIFDRLEQLS